MGQKASTAREFTPDTKPSKKENNFSLEKQKNEKKDIDINAKESLKEILTRLGVNVISKDSKILMEMESFIVDSIVIEKLKHPGDFKKIV